MADEEKTETEEQVEEEQAQPPAAEEPTDEQSEEAPAEEAPEEAAEVPEAQQASDGEPVGDEPESAPASAAEDAEEAPGPKQIRKRRRSQASGPPKPQRGSDERATERAERRRRNAAERRRYRASRRRRGGEPGSGTAPAERAAGPKKVRTGTVVSTRAAKTITVRIEVTRRHPDYEKVVRRSATLHAHDEAGQAQEGDVVRIVETRPLSRTKRWRLLEVLERAR